MKQQGLTALLVATVVGRSASTLRRWSRRERQGEALCRRRGPARAAACTHAQAGEVVRQLAGMIGAAALAKQTGLSRRQAAGVKASVVTDMERERKAQSERVIVSEPGIVRGFDQMYVRTVEGWRYPLVAADSSVPFRTSVLVAEAYDEDAVLAAPQADIAAWGAPLVYRLDRYSGHRTPKVQKLLEENGVVALHGPAHHPRYYGQMERQNREHREYLAFPALLRAALLPEVCRRMIAALNTTWPRRALGWRTPAEAWAKRRPINAEERASFCAEVYDRHAKLERDEGMESDLAMRLAIEQALQQRGYLRVERPNGAN
jgi:transposase InsO family protein